MIFIRMFWNEIKILKYFLPWWAGPGPKAIEPSELPDRKDPTIENNIQENVDFFTLNALLSK